MSTTTEHRPYTTTDISSKGNWLIYLHAQFNDRMKQDNPIGSLA